MVAMVKLLFVDHYMMGNVFYPLSAIRKEAFRRSENKVKFLQDEPPLPSAIMSIRGTRPVLLLFSESRERMQPKMRRFGLLASPQNTKEEAKRSEESPYP